MPYQPIESYGLIGNLRAAALVGTDGSIDWLCLPPFDPASAFAALLDDHQGGRFRIAPPGDDLRPKQFYWPNENYEEVMYTGWDPQRRAFVQAYGSTALDTSNLLMPLVFFTAPRRTPFPGSGL